MRRKLVVLDLSLRSNQCMNKELSCIVSGIFCVVIIADIAYLDYYFYVMRTLHL